MLEERVFELVTRVRVRTPDGDVRAYYLHCKESSKGGRPIYFFSQELDEFYACEMPKGWEVYVPKISGRSEAGFLAPVLRRKKAEWQWENECP